ncbi:SWIM zinc finger family protein [Ilumatobacter nonamiensis]|uniref:SWIM zinc finger family protein n=1 Tax=Ilumatobacter nonamiensis TaxID=467093 RepID=UPI000346464D|nr:SWIM zinc finger family protein [Ilumatobacter nonamiensis]
MVWSVEQIEAVAPSSAAITAAQPLAAPARWRNPGCDDRVLWGSFQGSGAEPYDTAVDHVGVGFRCTCPSRRTPCKHALALLLMWSRDQVPTAIPGERVEAWIRRRATNADRAATEATDGDDTSAATSDLPTASTADESDDVPPPPPPDPDRDAARDERVERMMAGLTELDRWLDDRIRTGLADPALARYGTWDDLAARLVDAQAGSLANRIRRLAGLVGASPTWHDDVLAELGLLHLLSQAGRRLGALPSSLADAVATTVGWQVRKADVLGGVPDTDHWVVAGRSDQREDRIEVRRHWLRGETSGRWALVLSFAAYQQSLDESLEVGTVVHADLHRYPGPALRALVGTRHADPEAKLFPGDPEPGPRAGRPPGQPVEAATDEIGRMLVAEPWLDRVPTSVTASIVRRGDAWLLGDDTGTLPILSEPTTSPRRSRAESDAVTMLLALSAGRPVDLTVEWTPHGVVPLAVHLDHRSIDIGPRADASFVGAS